MELRPLLDVDLREVLAPINRAARGEFLPALRTAAQLRERVSCGVLDLKLSRACIIGGALGAACLVEHVADEPVAHIDALASDPLAQQRGAVRALIEAVQTAAAAAGVTELSILVSETDSALGSTLQSAGFSRRQAVERYALPGPPLAQSLPLEVEAGEPTPAARSMARPATVAEVVPLLATADPVVPLFAQRPSVLQRLSARLSGRLLFHSNESDGASTARAGVVFDRERKSLVALGGDRSSVAALTALVATRHGISYLDALPDQHPAAAALKDVGFVRSAVRVELICDPRSVVAARERGAAGKSGRSTAEGPR